MWEENVSVRENKYMNVRGECKCAWEYKYMNVKGECKCAWEYKYECERRM